MPEEPDVFDDVQFEDPEDQSAVEALLRAFTEFLKKGPYKYPGARKYPFFYPGQKKKYPWQKLKKKKGMEGLSDEDFADKVDVLFTEFDELKKTHEDLKKDFEEIKKELDTFKQEEMESKVNELVDAQEKLGMITEANKEEVLKNFSSLSLSQVESMIEASKKLQPVKTKSFKSDEADEGTSKKEIEAIETRIQDFEAAGLRTEELETKLAKLKGESE